MHILKQWISPPKLILCPLWAFLRFLRFLEDLRSFISSKCWSNLREQMFWYIHQWVSINLWGATRSMKLAFCSFVLLGEAICFCCDEPEELRIQIKWQKFPLWFSPRKIFCVQIFYKYIITIVLSCELYRLTPFCSPFS